VHHAMRTVGKCQRAIEMMLERAVSRRTKGKQLSEHQFVQGPIGQSIIELEQFRLLVLKTAWIIDNEPHGAARTHIAMCKVQMAKVYHDIVQRAIQIHGSLGVTLETPIADMWMGLPSLALADGPTEVHLAQVARAYLKNTKPAPGLFPSDHGPSRLAAHRKESR
jgi:acyl-CoA dehydrogenase